MPWLVGYPREKIEWYPTIDQEKCGPGHIVVWLAAALVRIFALVML